MLLSHPTLGAIALSLLLLLYVRKDDIASLTAHYAWKSRTKNLSENPLRPNSRHRGGARVCRRHTAEHASDGFNMDIALLD